MICLRSVSIFAPYLVLSVEGTKLLIPCIHQKVKKCSLHKVLRKESCKETILLILIAHFAAFQVTRLLLYLAQGSHEVVPPDAVEEVLKAIANNFITERNSSEVMAVGLNAVREICARCPLAMSEDLLQDLVQYRTHRDKGISNVCNCHEVLNRLYFLKCLYKVGSLHSLSSLDKVCLNI